MLTTFKMNEGRAVREADRTSPLLKGHPRTKLDLAIGRRGQLTKVTSVDLRFQPRKVRMVECIEEIGVKHEAHALSDRKRFADGCAIVPETRPPNPIAFDSSWHGLRTTYRYDRISIGTSYPGGTSRSGESCRIQVLQAGRSSP